MEGKFVGFQILERDAERGQIYPYPASAEDVATQLRTMGYVVFNPESLRKGYEKIKGPCIKVSAMEALFKASRNVVNAAKDGG